MKLNVIEWVLLVMAIAKFLFGRDITYYELGCVFLLDLLYIIVYYVFSSFAVFQQTRHLR